ncbi:MAG: DUF362 domain-containing protein [Desulfatibacillaceae bacterium]
MNKVSLQKCEEYDREKLADTITQGLRDIGFDPATLSGRNVVLKPNILMPSPAEKAVTTHPEFFAAACRVVTENGGNATVVESPAMASLDKAMRKIGFAEIAEQYGVAVADPEDAEVLFCEDAVTYKRFEISRAFHEADIIINLPKFKTHGITYMTGAVKNLFGSIAGLNKSRWHMKVPDPGEFAEMLLDLNVAFVHGFDPKKTMLHVMDAVVGQEGEGPGPAGKPKHIGAVIVGQSPVAVDCVATRVSGLSVKKVHTINAGYERDLGVSSEKDIEIVGERIEDMVVSGYQATRNSIFSNMMRGPLTSRTLRNWMTEKPFPQKDLCTLCYQCMKICPAKAISKAEKGAQVPAYDYDKCIRCYCCAEICPEAAIRLKKGWLQKLAS